MCPSSANARSLIAESAFLILEGIGRMTKLKAVHRITGALIMIVLMYLSVTGLMMQGIDLSQIIRGGQPVDPDLAGAAPANGSATILTSADKKAAALPGSLNINAAIQSTVASGRTVVGDAPLGFVDLRMKNGKLVGTIQTALLTASVDDATGSVLDIKLVPQALTVTPLDRIRYRIKEYHRMTIFGPVWVLYINVIVGVALFLMAITGVWLYSKMWIARRKQGHKAFFWVGGAGLQDDWKRAVHRGLGVSVAIFLVVVAFSGEWIAYESLIMGYHMQQNAQMRRAGGKPNGPSQGGPGSGRNQQRLPDDAEIQALAITTWNAVEQAANGEPVKVIRIRAQGNNPQGIAIIGSGSDTRQVAFNAQTGVLIPAASLQNNSGFPWGMDAHQIGKGIHRGSIFGTWARYIDFLTGMALLYLSINGLALYIDFRKEVWKAKKQVAMVTS
jgi:uncharacterized iron-regulated membrane protein